MKNQNQTLVIFRAWKSDGGVIALFPLIDAGTYYCESFEHVGQHSGADYIGCMQATKPATPKEYRALAHELRSAPYNYKLKIGKRRPNNWLKLFKA